MQDKQKYINALRKCAKEHANDTTYTGHIRVSDLCRDTANLLEELEQEPKIKAKWIDDKVDDFSRSFGFEKFHCSNCKTIIKGSLAEKSNFCPNCGAKMDKENGDANK